MKASDLSHDAKQQLLDKVRDQVGLIEYGNLLNELGEDHLMDLVLQSLGTETDRKDRKGSWRTNGGSVMILGGILVLILLGENSSAGFILGTYLMALGCCWSWLWGGKLRDNIWTVIRFLCLVSIGLFFLMLPAEKDFGKGGWIVGLAFFLMYLWVNRRLDSQ